LRILDASAIVLLFAVIAPLAVPGQQTGLDSTCASCHPAEAASESRTPMGKAMELPGTDPELATHPKLTFQKGIFSYTVETREGKSTYSVTDGTETITLPIQWNFGEGAQTWVLVRNGQYYESLVSYYPSIEGLDITTGDEALNPTTLEEAIGRKLSTMDVKACFGCHSTNTVLDGKLSLDTLKPGVRCSHCHEGSELHVFAEETSGGGDLKAVPPDLTRLNSEGISNFCGQCHRTWETVVRSGWHGVMTVRFQPYRLANSRCFDGTDPRISCLACHDPHQTVVRDEASYDPKCIACHGTKGSGVPKSAPAGAKSCPVGTSNCASCHMPSTPLIRGRMVFHDHQIRVVKPGEAYPD
jgi:Cytochrome c554 and c-prime